MIDVTKINEGAVLELAELMQQKEILIRDMRNAVKRLNEDKTMMVDIQLMHGKSIRALRSSKTLADAINSQSEWIIDRVYDTAIQALETEIALLAKKVMTNLIESHKPY